MADDDAVERARERLQRRSVSYRGRTVHLSPKSPWLVVGDGLLQGIGIGAVAGTVVVWIMFNAELRDPGPPLAARAGMSSVLGLAPGWVLSRLLGAGVACGALGLFSPAGESEGDPLRPVPGVTLAAAEATVVAVVVALVGSALGPAGTTDAIVAGVGAGVGAVYALVNEVALRRVDDFGGILNELLGSQRRSVRSLLLTVLAGVLVLGSEFRWRVTMLVLAGFLVAHACYRVYGRLVVPLRARADLGIVRHVDSED